MSLRFLTLWSLKEDGEEGAEVSFVVLEGEEVSRESTSWDVLDGSNVLNISGVLALAAHPHSVELKLLKFMF